MYFDVHLYIMTDTRALRKKEQEVIQILADMLANNNI